MLAAKDLEIKDLEIKDLEMIELPAAIDTAYIPHLDRAVLVGRRPW